MPLLVVGWDDREKTSDLWTRGHFRLLGWWSDVCWRWSYVSSGYFGNGRHIMGIGDVVYCCTKLLSGYVNIVVIKNFIDRHDTILFAWGNVQPQSALAGPSLWFFGFGRSASLLNFVGTSIKKIRILKTFLVINEVQKYSVFSTLLTQINWVDDSIVVYIRMYGPYWKTLYYWIFS